MKSIIKSLLPQAGLNAARYVQSRAGLSRAHKRAFNAQNLRKQSDFDLQAMLGDADVAQEWMSDHAAILDLYGGDDTYGGVNPGDRRALYTLIRSLKPQNVLEIGTHIGASTLYIAKALKANGGGHVTSVDILDVNAPDAPWRDLGLKRTPAENLKHLDCAEHVTFVAKPAQDYMRETHETFDFIFLDGDHRAVSVYGEVAHALERLAPGGVILLHDYYPEGQALFNDSSVIYGPFQGMARIMSEQPGITVLPLGALPWPTKQGSHMTSLAVVLRSR